MPPLRRCFKGREKPSSRLNILVPEASLSFFTQRLSGLLLSGRNIAASSHEIPFLRKISGRWAKASQGPIWAIKTMTPWPFFTFSFRREMPLMEMYFSTLCQGSLEKQNPVRRFAPLRRKTSRVCRSRASIGSLRCSLAMRKFLRTIFRRLGMRR